MPARVAASIIAAPANVAEREAFKAFAKDVETGQYPEMKHEIHMDDEALERFQALATPLLYCCHTLGSLRAPVLLIAVASLAGASGGLLLLPVLGLPGVAATLSATVLLASLLLLAYVRRRVPGLSSSGGLGFTLRCLMAAGLAAAAAAVVSTTPSPLFNLGLGGVATVVTYLLVLWLLGLVSGYTLGGFGSVTAQSGGGIDTAILGGGSGNDDFVGGPTSCSSLVAHPLTLTLSPEGRGGGSAIMRPVTTRTTGRGANGASVSARAGSVILQRSLAELRARVGALPALRRRLKRDLKQPGLPRMRILAAIVTLLTQPTDEDTLVRFYREVQPAGFWGPVARRVQERLP